MSEPPPSPLPTSSTPRPSSEPLPAPGADDSSNILPFPLWTERARTHAERVQAWTAAFRERSSRGQKHPVYDFLFTYYSFRPAQLETWHPGIGVQLEYTQTDQIRAYTRSARYRVQGQTVSADPTQITPQRFERIRWIQKLLRNIDAAPPRFGCFGLHEWAMVYQAPSDGVRHSGFHLRLSPRETASVVEEASLACTHFDAFRFFTPEAAPRNQHQPSLDSRLSLEQSGCLHTNMDLYKWAYKLSPWVCSELIADAFVLAAKARELDMRAGPYDLRTLGFDPIAIETPDGRREYEARQRALSSEARPVRQRLLDAIIRLLKIADP
jgi:hypothetical protein